MQSRREDQQRKCYAKRLIEMGEGVAACEREIGGEGD